MHSPRIQLRPYAKMILHALKYPHCAIVGILIGKEDGSGIVCVDAVPVLHESASLLTALETALVSVDDYCLKASLRITGIYFCNETLSDDSLDQFATRAADKIVSHCPNAILIQILNTKLSLESTEPAIAVYTSIEAKSWKTKKFILEDEESSLGTVSVATQTKLYREIFDFENHLDDPAKDFWNSALNKKIERLSADQVY